MDFNIQNKELIVRKRTAAFIEKALKFCGYDFRHDDYKKIVYGEMGCNTLFEYVYKNMYDAYCYLLSNAQSPLSSDILKRFFYLINGKEIDEVIITRMTTKLFYINDLPTLEKAVDYHLYVYSELNDIQENYRLVISLMFFNYILIKSNIPTLRFTYDALQKYVEYRSCYWEKDKSKLYLFFLEQIQEAKFQDKSFYKNLKTLSAKEVYDQILHDQDMIKANYGIKSIAIFGSFAKNFQRIDSDIDMLVKFSENLTYDTKLKLSNSFSEYYFNLFNRYVDVIEIGDAVSDWIIKETNNYKKIF